MLVDSHAHWDFKDFDDEHDLLWARAREAGVGTVLSIGTKPQGWSKVLALADTYPDLYATIGVHPCDSKGVSQEGLTQTLCAQAAHKKVVGLGETGLDFFHTPFDAAHQETLFACHMEAGHTLDLPLVVHSRDAEEATVAMLKEGGKTWGVRAVIHCFSGSLTFAKACLDLGCYLSFSGILTFKKAEVLQEVARYAPLDRVLVETDAPYLAPHPYRGKRNESAFVRYTAEKLAELRGVSFDDVARATTDNFFTLFTKASPPCT